MQVVSKLLQFAAHFILKYIAVLGPTAMSLSTLAN